MRSVCLCSMLIYAPLNGTDCPFLSLEMNPESLLLSKNKRME